MVKTRQLYLDIDISSNDDPVMVVSENLGWLGCYQCHFWPRIP
jgi:hypothetical protein